MYIARYFCWIRLLLDTLDVIHVGVREHEKEVEWLSIKREPPLLSTGSKPMAEKVLEEIGGYFYFSRTKPIRLIFV